jgi:hemolysin-activating ACP:hemolysin acyltransferase
LQERKGGFAPFLLIALLPGFGTAAFAAAEPASVAESPPAKVLFVGNSFTYYNNSLHNHYRKLVAASGHEFDKPSRARIMTISGGHLTEHAGGITKVVGAEEWDVVVMQGHSLGPISEATAEPFRAAAREYSEYIRDHGARPVFFMTWAYIGRPEMMAKLDAAYSELGHELDAQVVPVGLAFATVTEQRPDIALRIADARHPTLAGTYLAACTFYAALHNESPNGLVYTAGLDEEEATYLQRVAWKTVTDYNSRETE